MIAALYVYACITIMVLVKIFYLFFVQLFNFVINLCKLIENYTCEHVFLFIDGLFHPNILPCLPMHDNGTTHFDKAVLALCIID